VDGCTITKTLPVTVFNASLSVSNDLVVCAGETFSVSGTGTATGAYSWTPGNISSPSFTETLNNEQIIQYGLLYTYGTPGNECFLTDTVTVQVLRDFAIKIVADPDSVYNVGEAVMLDAVIQPSQILTGFTFSWLENNTLPIGNTQEITVTSQTTENTIAYTVTVVSPNGCSQVETIVMRVLQPKVEIPNAFTPNGDGSNDAFRLAIIEGVVVLERLEVYNRWGQKVYESTDAAAEWDGRTDGKDAPSDVYVYKIRYRRGDGSLVLDSGEVTLLR
jgi:gliding motility-associated-like protein